MRGNGDPARLHNLFHIMQFMVGLTKITSLNFKSNALLTTKYNCGPQSSKGSFILQCLQMLPWIMPCVILLCPVWYYWLVGMFLDLKKKFFFQISCIVLNSETCNKSIQLLKDGYPTRQKRRDFKLPDNLKDDAKTHSNYNKISGSSIN